MLPVSLIFQAYTPKSLGKPLLSYFRGNSLFHPKRRSNHTKFKQKLEEKDKKGYTWLPELGGFITNNYFATDNSDLHQHHDKYSARLQVNLNIDFEKIGSFKPLDRIFTHKLHLEDTKPKWNEQHLG